MQLNTITLTVKLQIRPLGDKEAQNEVWRNLRNINRDVFKAANLLMSHLHFVEAFEHQFMQTDRILEKEMLDRENKKKNKKLNAQQIETIAQEIAEIKQKRKELKIEVAEKVKIFYNGKNESFAYNFIRHEYPQIPSYSVSILVKTVQNKFKEEWKEVKKGEKSISNFKKTIPIPIDDKQIANTDKGKKLCYIKKEGEKFVWELNSLEAKFEIVTGKYKQSKYMGEDKNKRTTLERVMNFEYKVADSSLKIEENKIFLLLVCKIPQQQATSLPNVSIGVDLGIRTPACIACNDGLRVISLGSKQDFLAIRQRFYEHRKRLQKSLAMTKGGKGREKKLKALEKLRKAERNWVRTYNHTLSKKIIHFAIQCRASRIQIELLEGFGRNENKVDEKGNYLLGKWSYYELQNMIKQKAEQYKLVVTTIDPYHTSKTCHVCGELGYRKGADFFCQNERCKEYQKRQNADHNAAFNIAKSTTFVAKKEDCTYFKLEQEKKSKKEEE
ncbi:MAG: hypothetical protein OHK0057_22740 [Thermoflexibacter sp.]|uniref:Transposase, IS605 OrfB family, central region n=1 Tax=Thermoflexibacter ruber TaxID=1003 RepID=A0A1I2AWU2_9BACT|nr:RNA-guided endonuclease TnpB family protein [Thermoflexibacter ruber]SFE48229.1 transposase, IS605 OrfB family, central region [Thermoflexibacter ruber]